MAYYQDFRQYLGALERYGKLTRVRRAINKDTELSPLVRLQFRGLPEERRTGFLFENVVDGHGHAYGIPVAASVLAGSAEIYALGMMCRPEENSEKIVQAELHPVPPTLVSSGPVQEEVHAGQGLLEHGGLGEFPVPVATPGYDPAPYLTASCVVTKDPETGVPNIGMYRAMVKSPNHTGLRFGLSSGARIHWHKCHKLGIPLEAAMVVGATPNLAYAAVTKFPIGMSEFDAAGGIAGEPVPLVKCKTMDLEVPATAEVVFEGEVSTEWLEPEAPFGEALSFIGQAEMARFFDVRCITHRRNPIWVATMSQYPPSESSKIRQYANEGVVFKYLKYDLSLDCVTGVSFFDPLGSINLIAVRFSRTQPEDVRRALDGVAERYPGARVVVAVDGDVNVRDLDSVGLAVCLRAQPHRDYRIVKVPVTSPNDLSVVPPDELASILMGTQMDRTSMRKYETSRVFIDATRKWPYPPLSLPKKEFMDRALKIWNEEGLPELDLKEPWWGLDLGFWSEEAESLARQAVQSNPYRAGELYRRRRQRPE